MSWLHVNTFKHFRQQQISGFFGVAFKHDGGDEIDEETCNEIGETHKIKRVLNHFFLQITLESYHDVLNKLILTISNLRLLVTDNWHY